jgi:hypothetical protein
MKNSLTGILSLSDRAIEAYEEGKTVYSNLAAWQRRAVDKGAVSPCEWHHTSAAANRTNFYALDDFADLNPADFPPAKIDNVEQGDLSRLRITITYKKMIGGFSSRARKKYEEVTVCGLDVRKQDGAITGAGGRRLSSNNTSVVYKYKPPRARKWRQVTLAEIKSMGYYIED